MDYVGTAERSDISARIYKSTRGKLAKYNETFQTRLFSLLPPRLTPVDLNDTNIFSASHACSGSGVVNALRIHWYGTGTLYKANETE